MKALRVLVVEDDKDFAEGLAELLEGRGHDVSLATTGEDGVDRLLEDDFDLAFLDVLLPGLSGIDALRAVKSVMPDTEIGMITVHIARSYTRVARAMGAQSVLQKPFEPSRLFDCLAELEKEDQR
jgi:CheY-like chemotaxis protein